MKYTEQLKKLLGDEAFKKIEGELKDKEIYLLEPKDYITKETFNKVNDENKTLKSEKEKLSKDLNTANDKVKQLEDKSGNEKKTVEEQFEALNKKIETLENSGKEKDTQLLREKKLSVLKDHLTKAKVNPRYIKHAVGEFKLDDMEVDENEKIKGWDDMIKPVQENYPDFFGENKISGKTPEKGKEEGDKEIKEQSTEDFLQDVFDGKT
jgi:hypothetical protein